MMDFVQFKDISVRDTLRSQKFMIAWTMEERNRDDDDDDDNDDDNNGDNYDDKDVLFAIVKIFPRWG